MKDIGWTPQFIHYTSQFYTPQTVAGGEVAGHVPRPYVGLSHLPFELSDRFPMLADIKEQLTAAVANPRFTEYTAEAYSAWTLLAQVGHPVRRRPHLGLRAAEGRSAHRLDRRRAYPAGLDEPDEPQAQQLLAGHPAHAERLGLRQEDHPARTPACTTATRRT